MGDVRKGVDTLIIQSPSLAVSLGFALVAVGGERSGDADKSFYWWTGLAVLVIGPGLTAMLRYDFSDDRREG